MRAPAADPADAAAPLLAVEHLRLVLGTHPPGVLALTDVSFALCKGERLVVIGPSGCGKSSLLNAVAGFIAPAEGEIAVHGVRVTGPGPDRMVVFQEFDQLLPWKTVLDNIAFPLRIARKVDVATARSDARAMLIRVGLSDFADAYPHTLSGGMKQRVAIARALAMRPDVLLMDEPFAALDALTRRKMQHELVSLWRAHDFTLLLVTHGIDEAIVVGSRILVLSARPGRVIASFDVAGFGPEDRGTPAFAALERVIQDLLLPPGNTLDA